MFNRNDQWPAYEPQAIEPKWQQNWEQDGLYLTLDTSDRPKFYCLDFFPYPSGEGLHVGHCRNYVPTDVLSRYKRMQGFNVLHPMGWDAFGEPTEQFAVTHGVHPRLTTDRNTANFRRQMELIGTSYDWSREIDSSRPEFYRWTQWFFLLLYKRGLAYRDTNLQWTPEKSRSRVAFFVVRSLPGSIANCFYGSQCICVGHALVAQAQQRIKCRYRLYPLGSTEG